MVSSQKLWPRGWSPKYVEQFFAGICKYFTYSVTFMESFLDLWLLQVTIFHVVKVHCYVWLTRFKAMAMPPVALSISFGDTNFKSYKTVIIYYQPRCPVLSLSISLALVFTAAASRSYSAAKLLTTCCLHSPREFWVPNCSLFDLAWPSDIILNFFESFVFPRVPGNLKLLYVLLHEAEDVNIERARQMAARSRRTSKTA